MEIRTCTKEDLEDLLDFSMLSYPDRKANRDVVNFWFRKNREAYKYVTIIKEKGKIVGQMYCSPMNYYYKNNKISGIWGFDLYVTPEKRKLGYGLDLLEDIIDRYPNLYATGSNETALKIELSLGYKQIGELKKYISLISFLGLFLFPFRRKVKLSDFPKTVNIKGDVYGLVDDIKEIVTGESYNEDLIEGSRELDFVEWYYGRNIHEYAIYKHKNSGNFFVMRTIVKNNILMMALVDYRCSLKEESEFISIVKAAQKVTHFLFVPFLVTSSTLAITDFVLENMKYKSMGRPRPIITMVNWSKLESKIRDRSLIHLNLVDSDGEINW